MTATNTGFALDDQHGSRESREPLHGEQAAMCILRNSKMIVEFRSTLASLGHIKAKDLGISLPLVSVYGPGDAAKKVNDQSALLTVKTTQTKPKLKQDITVHAEGINRVFKFSGSFLGSQIQILKIPYPLDDCTDRKGFLYLKGDIPDIGSSIFNAKQYPRYPDAKAGEVVIAFWEGSSIRGIFTSKEENLVSIGEGSWEKIDSSKPE